ncbi:hypothetical protein B0H14DRAFT_2765783, partial [Mycena olivaceomarginata]
MLFYPSPILILLTAPCLLISSWLSIHHPSSSCSLLPAFSSLGSLFIYMGLWPPGSMGSLQILAVKCMRPLKPN